MRHVTATAARLGLPTRMLQAVVAYGSFGDASENYTSRLTSRLYLNQDTVTDAESWTEESLPGPSGAVGTVYHESVHQYLETSESPAIKEFIREGVRAYTPADVRSRHPGIVETNSDPKSVFHEAVAGYVGHRISTWEHAREQLEARARLGSLTPEGYKFIVDTYNQQMRRRVFGYQDTPSWAVVLGEPARKDTTMRIPEGVRAFADTVLLEGRIPDRFQDDPLLRSYASKVTSKEP